MDEHVSFMHRELMKTTLDNLRGEIPSPLEINHGQKRTQIHGNLKRDFFFWAGNKSALRACFGNYLNKI